MILPDDWVRHPIYNNGEEVGCVWIKDAEIHCYRDESCAGRWIKAGDLQRLTGPLFKQYGHMITKVRKINLQGQAFVKRLGFTPTGQDDTNIHYRCERLKHARY